MPGQLQNFFNSNNRIIDDKGNLTNSWYRFFKKLAELTIDYTGTDDQVGVNSQGEISLANNLTLPGSEKVTIPSGMTASRPSSPVIGDLRFSTTFNDLEYYSTSGWKTLDDMALQNSSNVLITGGSISISNLVSDLATLSNVTISAGTITGITPIAVADGGTGASTASDARTNLGLGTLATQNSNNVNITGGTLTGVTITQIAPKFRAYRNTSTQTISTGAAQKVQFNGVTYDTNSNYDSTTNYRFTPTVAGKYLITSTIRITTAAGSFTYTGYIYKNGSVVAQTETVGTIAAAHMIIVEDIIDMNGSTDYVEIYVSQNTGANQTVTNGENLTRFAGSLLV